jgi:hypothetical protein
MPVDCHAKAPDALRDEAVLPAQPRDPMASTPQACQLERPPQFQGPVAGFRLSMELLDLLKQPGVGRRPCTSGALAPGIVAAPADAQRATQPGEPVFRAMCLDEAILHGDSRAKNVAAFFKRSRSSRSSAFSRANA